MFYNLQAQEGWISDNEILSSLELSEGGMEVDNLNDPFSLLPSAVQSTTMTFPSHNTNNPSTKFILNNKPQNINDCNNTTNSLIESDQQNIMQQQTTTTNPNNHLLHYRDGSNVQSADHQFSRQNGSHVTTLKPADHFSRQNGSHVTTLKSAEQFSRQNNQPMTTPDVLQPSDQFSRLNGGHMSIDSNINSMSIQDFDPETDLSSFLKHELFAPPRLSPQYMEHPASASPMHQGVSSTSPMHHGLPPTSPLNNGLPPTSPLSHGLPPTSPHHPNGLLGGNFQDLGSFEPMYRSRSNTWHGVLQAPQVSTSNNMDTDSCDDQLPPSSNPPASSYLPLLSEEMPYEDTDSVSGNLGSQGLKSKTTRRNPWGSYSYADLITQAIQSSAEKRLTLSQIYDWLINNIAYFKERSDVHASAGWKNSIRHNLSLHNKFVKMNNEGSGKSSWWTLMPEVGAAKPPRRRANSMESSKLKKERDRAFKGVKARLERSSSTTSNGSSILEPSSPSTFFRGYEYRQRTFSNASLESCHRLQTPSTPPTPPVPWLQTSSTPPTPPVSMLPSSPPSGLLSASTMTSSAMLSAVNSPPAAVLQSMSHSSTTQMSAVDFGGLASDIVKEEFGSFDMANLNIHPGNSIREYFHPELEKSLSTFESVIKEENLLEDNQSIMEKQFPTKLTHKLTILEPREPMLMRQPSLPTVHDTPHLMRQPSLTTVHDTPLLMRQPSLSTVHDTPLLMRQPSLSTAQYTPVIMYSNNANRTSSTGSSVHLYGKYQKGGSGVQLYSGHQKDGSGVQLYSGHRKDGSGVQLYSGHTSTAITDGDWINHKDEDIAEILGLKTCNTIQREIERREMINIKIEEMKSSLQDSESDADRSILQWLQEMAESPEKISHSTEKLEPIIKEEVEPMSSELDSVPSDLDFSVFNDICMHLSSPPPLQPLQERTTTFSNKKDDISASKSSVNSMTSSTAGASMTSTTACAPMSSTTTVASMKSTTDVNSMTSSTAVASIKSTTGGDSMFKSTAVASTKSSSAVNSMTSSTASTSVTSSTAVVSVKSSTAVAGSNSSGGLEELAIKNFKQIMCL